MERYVRLQNRIVDTEYQNIEVLGNYTRIKGDIYSIINQSDYLPDLCDIIFLQYHKYDLPIQIIRCSKSMGSIEKYFVTLDGMIYTEKELTNLLEFGAVVRGYIIDCEFNLKQVAELDIDRWLMV